MEVDEAPVASTIYHERQVGNFLLLLQQSLTPSTVQCSQNMDRNGNFSIQVIIAALLLRQLETVPFNSSHLRAVSARANSFHQDAFICHRQNHWFTLRKIGSKWYNLNSLFPNPVEILNDGTHLSCFSTKEMLDSFTGIFIVVGNLPQIASTSKTDKTVCNQTCEMPMELDNVTTPNPKKLQKRKATIGRKTKAALNKSRSRIKETPEQNVIRLKTARSYQEASRLSETIKEKQKRLASRRSKYKSAKSSENNNQSFLRQQSDRTRYILSTSKTYKGLENAAFNYDPETRYNQHPVVKIGKMDSTCLFCRALKWKSETPGMCCSSGKVKLEPLLLPPEPLKTLLSGSTQQSKHFLSNIRRYNSIFQMTSFGATKVVREGGFMPTFKVQGQVYHLAGSLLPLPNEEASYLQIYFMGDERLEASRRKSIYPGLDENIVHALQQMLHQFNSYINSFKYALERMPSDERRCVIRADKTPVGEHERRRKN